MLRTYSSLNPILVAAARQMTKDGVFLTLRYQRARPFTWPAGAILCWWWGRHALRLENTWSENANPQDVQALAKELDLYAAFDHPVQGMLYHSPRVWVTVLDDGGPIATSLIGHLLQQQIPTEVVPAAKFDILRAGAPYRVAFQEKGARPPSLISTVGVLSSRTGYTTTRICAEVEDYPPPTEVFPLQAHLGECVC